MRSKVVVGPARRNLHMRYGGDAGYGFAAEPQRADGKDIFDGADLARRMADNALARVFGTHAAAVIGNAHIRLTAVGYFHFNSRRAGVDGVFHQFFDARRRPLYDFAGGNFIARRLVKQIYNRTQFMPLPSLASFCKE